MTTEPDLLAGFRAVLGAERVITSDAVRELGAQDVYRSGVLPLAVLQPQSTAEVIGIVHHARRVDVGLHTRGGGMSYTDAITPQSARAVIIDLTGLARVRSISESDLVATAEAGCTWAALDAALAPRGLRAKFWGPMSGAKATLGGGMSQGAATFGSGRHGSSAAAALGFEVVLGTGEVLDTARIGAAEREAFFRPYGPDITGLFTGDAGALGIKTAVTLQLEPRPLAQDSLSFAFADFESMSKAVAAVARRGLATEIFGVETALARVAAGDAALVQDARRLLQVVRAQGSVGGALRQCWRMISAGRSFLAGSAFLAHFLCEGADRRRLQLDLSAIRALLSPVGREVANSMAAVVQATPFPPPMLVGPGGKRLLPLHVILPHSAIQVFHADFIALRDRERARLQQHRAEIFVVFASVGPSALLYEPVIYWEDEWLSGLSAGLAEEYRAFLKPGAANPEGRAYVESLRIEIIELMRRHAGAHLQIGRVYPYLSGRSGAFAALLGDLKRAVDPDGIINPGALGLPS
jgi:D-lactate dehydrogenase (cytochrome)